MPVNSFENYPMSWTPDRERLSSPIYLSIARLLEEDILGGTLKAGTRLPPQRELADYLDLNLSTITRAYGLLAQKGLACAVTGRGTFVAPGVGAEDPALTPRGDDLIELGPIRPFYQCNALVLEAARQVTARPRTVRLLEYTSPLGTPWQRAAAAKWLKGLGLDVPAERVLLASGAQNALAVALAALFRAGDGIATDPYTYANFRGLAGMLGVRLLAAEGDGQGMSPDALDALCAAGSVRGVYLMPSLSNPMGVAMPAQRRKELARVIERRGLIAIEDDIYGFLHDPPIPPLASILPGRTVHICGTSKSLCAGLRVAFMIAPEALRGKVVEGMLHINLKTAALNAEILYELIESGLAGQIVSRKLALSRARNKVFEACFPGAPRFDYAPFFRWVPLPERMTGEDFELLAREKGVSALGSHRFAADGERPAAYARLALTSPEDEGQLETALRALGGILRPANARARELII